MGDNNAINGRWYKADFLFPNISEKINSNNKIKSNVCEYRLIILIKFSIESDHSNIVALNFTFVDFIEYFEKVITIL